MMGGGFGPHLIHGSLGPLESTPQTAITKNANYTITDMKLQRVESSQRGSLDRLFVKL